MQIDNKTNNRLIILSGPSCVGKTPLVRAFAKIHPQISNSVKKIILYNSREIRPDETDGVDYYFRKRAEIKKMKKNDQYLVMDIRGDLQAVDINELFELLEKSDVFFEGNTYIGKKLIDLPQIDGQNKLSVFLSPLSKSEIINLKSSPVNMNLADFISEMMRMKLVNRAKRFNPEITASVKDNINKRAADAYQELKLAWQFDYIIPNRDGEDSDNWQNITKSSSDAYTALQTFTLLLIGEKPKHAEIWPENLLT